MKVLVYSTRKEERTFLERAFWECAHEIHFEEAHLNIRKWVEVASTLCDWGTFGRQADCLIQVDASDKPVSSDADAESSRKKRSKGVTRQSYET